MPWPRLAYSKVFSRNDHCFSEAKIWSVIRHRLTLYADDLVIFIVPTEHDIRAVREIVDMFAGASALHTNVAKCQFTPICCTEEQVATMMSVFSCQQVQFPCRYLGIPLHVHRLKKADLQPAFGRLDR
jgi:hypothetical protein